MEIHPRKDLLTGRVAALRCFSKPFSGLRVVRRDTLSAEIQSTEVALSDNMPSFCSTAKPTYGLSHILVHATTVLIHNSQVVRGRGISVFRRSGVILKCFPIVARNTFA